MNEGRNAWAAQELFFAKRGWRPAGRAVPACPRVAAGKRCRMGTFFWHDCPCQRHRDLLDHGRVWLDAHGQHVVTGEPYGVHGEELAAMVADLEPLGLQVTVEADSPWYPGSTTLVLIERRA